MTLYYAMGGGLGHLVRARAVAHTLGMRNVTVLTASAHATDKRVVDGFDVVRVPRTLATAPVEYRSFLRDVLERIGPHTIVVDTFPAGILGELPDVLHDSTAALLHVARLMQPESYPFMRASLPYRFAATHIVEPLVPEHAVFLAAASDRCTDLQLNDPPASLPDLVRAMIEGYAEGRPLWLVVHSEPAVEIVQLLEYARAAAAMEGAEPAYVLVTPGLDMSESDTPDDVLHVDLHPATPLFPLADRIITACGFNAMRQTEPFRDRHRFMPFPRRYDDQFLRAQRRKMR